MNPIPELDHARPRQPIPEKYRGMEEEALLRAIRENIAVLREKLLILGHHYQRDDVFQFADIFGDSLKLSREAAGHQDREFVVFCGVHFMAETADIVSRTDQKVILPDLAAGCSLADTAPSDQVENAWEEMTRVVPATSVTPVTYINSAATLKAFVGREGGAVCTSSNAERIIRWGLALRQRVFFFPDQHLGRNTGLRMGILDSEMPLWDPRRPMGGLVPEQIERAKVILWKGQCSVHQLFLPEDVKFWRAKFADARVIVHPECRREVVDTADAVGSTEFIIKTVTAAPEGTTWIVGTELNLVNRLKWQNPNKKVFFLSPTVCVCSTMSRIDAPHLLWVLDELREGRVVNRVHVPSPTRDQALLAIHRMLELSAPVSQG